MDHPTCEVAGCPKAVVKRRMCNPHYLKALKYGDPLYVAKPVIEDCRIGGCDRKPRSKTAGLCEAHYVRIWRTGSPNLRLTVLDEPVRERCLHCGEPNDPTTVRARKWCSARCEMRGRRGRSSRPSACERCAVQLPLAARTDKKYCDRCEREVRNQASNVCKAKRREVERRARRRVWVAGQCRHCGRAYVAQFRRGTIQTYCSRGCVKGAVQVRRRARKQGAYRADVVRSRIFERDGWRCQICKRKVRRDKAVPDPLAPVLDHIIPLAAGAEQGGIHAPHNVQCAHFICNSIKGATVRDVQPALF